MPVIENEIFIRATPAQVWAVLADATRYPEWNPRLRRIDGTLSAGAVVTLHYAQVAGRFVVDVDACAPELELRWSGPRNGARHLMRASHWFRLSPQGAGTRLLHGERFDGVLAWSIWPLLRPIVATNHAAVNAAICARCEPGRA